MKHSIDWKDDAINAAPEERATVGDLRLFLNDQNVTLHMLRERNEDHVTIALFGLIDGLVHDWWSIFGARDREFSLRNYRTGYLLPDIRFTFDGAVFEIAAHQCAYVEPVLRFWGGASEALSRQDGEMWLSQIVKDVLGRLTARGVRGTSAELRWERIQASLTSRERGFCEAAGGLGLDPYQITEEVAAFIEDAELVFHSESLVEFVSGANHVDRSKLIQWVDRMNRHMGSEYRLADLRQIVEKISVEVPSRPGEEAWSAGYRRARAMRSALGLKQHHRFTTFMDLAKDLGAGKSYKLAPKVDGINALRREAANGVNVHLRNHGDYDGAKSTHLFALARAIGDVACFDETGAAPVNNLHNAYRQAAGRAFAAEFLAPIVEIRSMLADEKDEDSIADDLGVAPEVVRRQIENQSRIDLACHAST